MGKRKLEATTSAVTPAAKKPAGILKAEGTPTSVHKKMVTFPPPAELGDTLKVFSQSDGEVEEEDLARMTGMLDTLKGPSLVMWLTELQVSLVSLKIASTFLKCKSAFFFKRNVAALGKHKTDSMESFVTELLKLKWAGQGEEVSSAYIGFLVNLVSANTRFARPAIKNILGNFQGNDREVDSEIFSNR